MWDVSKRDLVHALAVALVLAVGGFCYATGTSGRGSGGAAGRGMEAGGRIVGSTPLRFTNPIFQENLPPASNIYDLGDALFGGMVTRYITVTGGVRPYSYASLGLDPSVLAFNSSLTLEPSGYLIGSVTQGTVTPLQFLVSATDSFGGTPNSLPAGFHLNLVTVAPTVFRFAVDRVNNGVIGKSHAAKLETIQGQGVQFSVLPNTLTLNGLTKGSIGELESLGLTLGLDGTIFGRPLETGQVSFQAQARDSQNRVAKDRTNTNPNQTITFNVEDNQIASTDFTTLDCHIKGDVGQFGKDSITFNGMVNLSSVQFYSLQGTKFVLHVGRASFPGYLNFKGQVVNQHGGPVVYADHSSLKATVNSRTGQVKGSVKGASLYGNGWKELADVQDRSVKRAGIMFNAAHFLFGSDMLEFATRRNGDKFSLDYKMGSLGTPLGGAFQVVSVKGANKKTIAGLPGVAWTTKFIAIPRYGVDANAGLDAIDILRVRMGTAFVQEIAGKYFSSSASGNTQLKTPFKIKGPFVSKLSFSSRKFTGALQTQPLSQFDTGLPQAVTATTSNFTLGLDVLRTGGNTNYYSEVGKFITTYPKQKFWSDQTHPVQ